MDRIQIDVFMLIQWPTANMCLGEQYLSVAEVPLSHLFTTNQTRTCTSLFQIPFVNMCRYRSGKLSTMHLRLWYDH